MYCFALCGLWLVTICAWTSRPHGTYLHDGLHPSGTAQADLSCMEYRLPDIAQNSHHQTVYQVDGHCNLEHELLPPNETWLLQCCYDILYITDT
jgi:hypothetical protein